jgi:hypothetical protein
MLAGIGQEAVTPRTDRSVERVARALTSVLRVTTVPPFIVPKLVGKDTFGTAFSLVDIKRDLRTVQQ